MLVLGAGFAGASLAWALKRWAPSLTVTVVASPERYWTCPFSNTALLKPTDLGALEVRYDAFSEAMKTSAKASASNKFSFKHRGWVAADKVDAPPDAAPAPADTAAPAGAAAS